MTLHPRWARLVVLLVMVGAYEGIVALHYRPFFFVPLSEIASQMVQHVREGQLIQQIAVSGGEVGMSLALAATLGLPLGLVIGSTPSLVAPGERTLLSVYSVPLIIVYPLLVVWLGLDISSKIAFGTLYAFFPIALNAIAGMRTVDADLLGASVSMGARPLDLILKVRLPSALPSVLTGLRIGLGMAVIGVLATEYLAGLRGLGYLLQETASKFNVAYLYGLIILVILLIGTLNTAFSRLEARWGRWRGAL